MLIEQVTTFSSPTRLNARKKVQPVNMYDTDIYKTTQRNFWLPMLNFEFSS